MSFENTTWDPRSIPQNYVISFFVDIYSDKASSIVSSAESQNISLNYCNAAVADITAEAQICAGLCMAYMENQGLEYHDGKTRKDCFQALVEHFNNREGFIIKTVDIIDNFYRFYWEKK